MIKCPISPCDATLAPSGLLQHLRARHPDEYAAGEREREKSGAAASPEPERPAATEEQLLWDCVALFEEALADGVTPKSTDRVARYLQDRYGVPA